MIVIVMSDLQRHPARQQPDPDLPHATDIRRECH